MVASMAALHGCGRVFLQRSRAKRRGGIGPSEGTRPLLAFKPELILGLCTGSMVGASLVSLNQQTLSSAFLHQALLPRPIHSNSSGTTFRLARHSVPTARNVTKSLDVCARLFRRRVERD